MILVFLNIILFLVIIFLWCKTNKDGHKDKEKAEFDRTINKVLKDAERVYEREEQSRIYDEQKTAAFAELEKKYGKCSFEITISHIKKNFSLETFVAAFEEQETLLFFGKMYKFSDILSYKLIQKKNPDYCREYCEDWEKYFYSLYLNLNSISSPTDFADLGWNEEEAHKISNLLNVIITRNKNKKHEN